MTSLRTHAEQHNTALYRDYKKDRKVGEGAYAVVYLGTTTGIYAFNSISYACSLQFLPFGVQCCSGHCKSRLNLQFVILSTWSLGTQLSTKKTVAIKKIKIGQFKDGLDMSAIREVKTLQELRHPNLIEVRSIDIVLFI